MKKYEVKLSYHKGVIFEFETNTDLKSLKPRVINGERLILDLDSGELINLDRIQKIVITERTITLIN